MASCASFRRKGSRIDPQRRPFVIVDPRAGHGPGIGGFKAESEVGVAFKAGHPCYFVGFLPEPMPGQTIEDIARAEAVFLEKVIALHPDADGKPCVIGNCQGGWAVMMLAAIRPELFGPIIIAGSPLSYWAGVHGKNPMRYSGGLLGGSWLTALTSDLGGGKFDGAWLVQNFENQNPANTLWTKQYNVYSKIDTEAPRYLGFERYWGGHVNLNAEEIQFIVDELFIGNNLAAGRIKTSDGVAIDLRNIRSPIVVFCSRGDNITPPQQALGWILDLYEDVDDIRSCGQTIVYTIHDTVGHLGIFVSGAVAKKEHGEFADNVDLIDTLPPGLYEAVFEPKTDSTPGADLVTGDWLMRCEMRTLDDIRALGGNDAADERRFATAARISEVNLALYRTFAQPVVRALVSAPVAETLQHMQPLKVQYEILIRRKSVHGPGRCDGRGGAQEPKACRFRQSFRCHAGNRVKADRCGARRLARFHGGGCGTDFPDRLRLAGAAGGGRYRSRRHTAAAKARQKLAFIMSCCRSGSPTSNRKFRLGGLREAVVRALIYTGMGRGSVDPRGFETVRRLRTRYGDMPLSEFKTLVREQYFMLLIDKDASLAALPSMLPAEAETRREAFKVIKEVMAACGELSS